MPEPTQGWVSRERTAPDFNPGGDHRGRGHVVAAVSEIPARQPENRRDRRTLDRRVQQRGPVLRAAQPLPPPGRSAL